MKATGKVKIHLYDKDGRLKETRQANNLVVTTGRNYIASRMINDTIPIIQYLDWGTNSTTPVLSNTNVLSPFLGGNREKAGITRLASKISYFFTDYRGWAGTVSEAGLFNTITPNTGIMLSRVVFDPITKSAQDSLKLLWEITIS